MGAKISQISLPQRGEVVSLSPMDCLVTAGPTFEPLDRVRRLTNFSTGTLGTALANHLVAAGHRVRLFRGESAVAGPPVSAVTVEPFSTTADLATLFLKHATSEPVAIFHAAAVSDFSFGPVFERHADGHQTPVHAGKLSTRDGSLWVELKPTPKLITGLREWFPRSVLVGWKYEVDGLPADTLERARAQLAAARSDACVANGPAHGPGFSLVTPGGVLPCADVAALFAALEHLLVRGAQ